jgi:energy-coupling factor transport system permease protein
MDLLRSLPLGLYLEQPITWLHSLDARVKLIWLLSFLLAPLLGNVACRIALVLLLIFLTFTAMIPMRVWRKQMGWLLIFSIMVFLITAIAPDGLAVEHQRRLPPSEITLVTTPPTEQTSPTRQPWYDPFGWFTNSEANQPTDPTKDTAKNQELPSQIDLPQPTDYRYVLFDQGPLKINRRSLDLGIRVSTLLFTLIYSTNLYLLTTAPEEITAGLEDLMSPLQRLNLPVTEVTLTLTLSLRFIPLVLEEVQNLIRAVRTRAINWKKLGWRRSLKVWLTVVERLLENLLLRASQIANSMQVRGFTSPNEHRVQWHQFRLKKADWLAVAGLVLLWGLRLAWGWQA